MTKSSIPESWRIVTLGSVAVRVMEKYEASPDLPEPWVGADHLDEGDLRIKRWSMSDDPVFPPTFKFKYPIGAVLIHSRNPKKVAIAEFAAITGEKIFALSSRDESILSPHFLAYVLQSARFEEFTDEWMTGSVNKFLNWSALEKFEFALPPIAEQQRIINLIKNIDQLVEANREIPFGQQREAMLLDLLNVNSQGLKSVCLNEISTISYGYTESAFREIIGPKFLRITDIQDGAVDWESVPYCRIDEAIFAKQKLNDGDIVFARIGSVGKSFLVRNPPDAVSASYLIRVQAVTTKVIPEFLFLNFQTRDYWKQIHAGKSGSVQGGFNASKLGRLEIPLPPLDKQLEIVDAMAALHNLEMKTNVSLKELSKLRVSLLNTQLDSGVPNVQ